MFIIKPLYMHICSTSSTAMLSAIQQIDYDHQIWYGYWPSFAKCFFCFI